MVSRAKSKWDKLDDRVKKWASRLTAIATIIGVLAAGGSVIINQLDNAVASRIESQTEAIQQEVQVMAKDREAADRHTELQLTRLELMMLMETDPSNIIEIEKVARHYFIEDQGNSYLSSLYGKWCKAYNEDCEIIFK